MKSTNGGLSTITMVVVNYPAKEQRAGEADICLDKRGNLKIWLADDRRAQINMKVKDRNAARVLRELADLVDPRPETVGEASTFEYGPTSYAPKS